MHALNSLPEVKTLGLALISSKEHLSSGSLCVFVRSPRVSRVRCDFCLTLVCINIPWQTHSLIHSHTQAVKILILHTQDFLKPSRRSHRDAKSSHQHAFKKGVLLSQWVTAYVSVCRLNLRMFVCPRAGMHPFVRA